MQIELKQALLRNWRATDAEVLAKHADNPKIAANLRDAFPCPYTRADAVRFITAAPDTYLAIEVAGEAAGGIGFTPGHDVERYSAELGYWLSEAHWGRGIITEAVAAVVRQVFAQTEIRRLFALPYASNTASARVLEKCGFVLEGRLRKSACKAGRFVDQLLFATLAPDDRFSAQGDPDVDG